MARGPLAGAAGPGKFSKRTDLDMGSIEKKLKKLKPPLN